MRRQELIGSFLRLEAAIALLSRSRPLNFAQEATQLSADWLKGNRRNPEWRYAGVGPQREVRSFLQRLEAAVQRGPWAELWCARCEEFELELQLIEAIGQPEIVRLSERRFRDLTWAEQAAALANEWVLSRPSNDAATEPTDSPAPTSLLSQMRAVVGAQRLPFRVIMSDGLLSAAATGEAAIWVVSGRTIFQEEVPRIVVHEVFGHAWPRVRAASESCELFAVGSARGNDTQEGFALWHEVAAQTQTERRRQELGLRHLAALSVWQGADWVQTVEMLLELGAPLGLAQTIAMRVHRGGGLAREVVYLQAYCQLLAALEREPSLLPWFGAGRLSADAILTMRAMGYQLAANEFQLAEGSHAIYGANSAITGM